MAGIQNKNIILEKINDTPKLKQSKSHNVLNKSSHNNYTVTPLSKPKSLQKIESIGTTPKKEFKEKLTKVNKNSIINQSEIDKLLENMYNTYSLSIGTSYLPYPKIMKSTSHRENQVNKEAVKKSIIDSNRSRIINPLFSRTTFDNYKLENKTINNCNYQPFKLEKAEIKPKKKINKQKMLIKDSTNIMSQPNQGSLGTFHVKTPQFQPQSIAFDGSSVYSQSFASNKNSKNFIPNIKISNSSIHSTPTQFKTTNNMVYNNNVHNQNNVSIEKVSQDKYCPTPTPTIHFMTSNKFEYQGANTFIPDKKVPAAQGLNYNSIFS